MSMPAKVNGGTIRDSSGGEPSGNKNDPPEVKVSPFEVLLATGGYDHTIKLWQAHTGQCLKTLQHSDSQVNALEINPGSGQLLAACGYQRVRMFDVNTSTPVVNYEGVCKNVMDVGFQEEGKWMYTGGEEGAAKLWDIRMRNLQCQKILQAKAPVNSVCLHPNQYEIFVGDSNGFIHVWNLKMDRTENFCPESGAIINHVDVSPQGTYLASVNNKGNVGVWSLSTHKPILEQQSTGDENSSEKPASTKKSMTELHHSKKFLGHKKYALKCKFSPCGKTLVTTSADQTAKLWNCNDNFNLIKELKVDNQRWVWDVAFSADSQYLFTASSDHLARLWSLKEYKIVREYSGHQKALTCLAFRDGKVHA